MARRETSSDVDRAAAAWAARLDRGPLSEAEKVELEGWRRADPRRLGALARAMAVLASVEELARPADAAPAAVASGDG